MATEETTVNNTPMTSSDERERAWTWATEQIEKVVKPPLNARGYPVDSWRVTGAEERVKMTMMLADWYLRGSEGTS
jgi:hypothetical protein